MTGPPLNDLSKGNCEYSRENEQLIVRTQTVPFFPAPIPRGGLIPEMGNWPTLRQPKRKLASSSLSLSLSLSLLLRARKPNQGSSELPSEDRNPLRKGSATLQDMTCWKGRATNGSLQLPISPRTSLIFQVPEERVLFYPFWGWCNMETKTEHHPF